MAWEWVSPTATAAVGIAAVGFASRTSRKGEDARARESESSRKHERELIVRRERLETFALFLGAVDAFDRVIFEAGHSLKSWRDAGHDDDEPSPTPFATMVGRFEDLSKLYYDVQLVGSDAVRLAASVVRKDAFDAWLDALDGKKDPRMLKTGPREALNSAMRQALGYVD